MIRTLHKDKLTVWLQCSLLVVVVVASTKPACVATRYIVVLPFGAIWRYVPWFVAVVAYHPRQVSASNIGHDDPLFVFSRICEHQARVVKSNIVQYHVGGPALHNTVRVVYRRWVDIATVKKGIV